MTYTSSETILVQNHDYNEVSWDESDQKDEGLKLDPEWIYVIHRSNIFRDRTEADHEKSGHGHAQCKESLDGPAKSVECVLSATFVGSNRGAYRTIVTMEI